MFFHLQPPGGINYLIIYFVPISFELQTVQWAGGWELLGSSPDARPSQHRLPGHSCWVTAGWRGVGG